jgi:hypothetical protein
VPASQLCFLILCWLFWVFCLSFITVWTLELVCGYPHNYFLGFGWNCFELQIKWGRTDILAILRYPCMDMKWLSIYLVLWFLSLGFCIFFPSLVGRSYLFLKFTYVFIYWIWTQCLVFSRQALHPRAMPLALCDLSVFQVWFHIHAQASQNNDPPIYASCVAGVIGACHHVQLFLVEMGSHKLLCPASPQPPNSLAWNLDLPNLGLPGSLRWRAYNTTSSYWLRWGLRTFYMSWSWTTALPVSGFPPQLGWQACITMPSLLFLLQWSLPNFFPGLALNPNPPRELGLWVWAYVMCCY